MRASVTTIAFRLIALPLNSVVFAHSAAYPLPVEGDHVLRDFRFRSGEILPEVRTHYRTFGQPVRDAQGIVRNAVLILHGTTGSSGQFLRDEFAGDLFGPGQTETRANRLIAVSMEDSPSSYALTAGMRSAQILSSHHSTVAKATTQKLQHERSP